MYPYVHLLNHKVGKSFFSLPSMRLSTPPHFSHYNCTMQPQTLVTDLLDWISCRWFAGICLSELLEPLEPFIFCGHPDLHVVGMNFHTLLGKLWAAPAKHHSSNSFCFLQGVGLLLSRSSAGPCWTWSLLSTVTTFLRPGHCDRGAANIEKLKLRVAAMEEEENQEKHESRRRQREKETYKGEKNIHHCQHQE